MSRTGLTELQQVCLAFIAKQIEVGAKCPTFNEIKTHMGIVHSSQVHRMITSLERRGYIRRLPGRSRAIEIVEDPAKTALDILPSDTRNFVIGFAKAEGKSPDVLMAEWVRQRCEDERRVNAYFAEQRSA